MLSLLIWTTLAAVQEPGRIAIDRTGTIDELVEELIAASGAAIRIDNAVDKRAFAVKVSGATFYEALDAICRAHGGACYLHSPIGPVEGKVDLVAGKFLDVPSCYVGDLKVIIPEFTEHTAELPVGPKHWCRASVLVLGPPWLRVASANNAKAVWTLEEARDADGKDVLPSPTEGEPDHRLDLAYGPTVWKGNLVYRTFRLHPFDLDRGLSILKGKVQLTVGDAKEIAIPFEEGKTIDTPVGTISVDSIREAKDKIAPVYHMGLTLQPVAGIKNLKQAIETRYRVDGEGRENLHWMLDLPNAGMSFTGSVRAPKPGTIRIVVHQGERRLDVPFEFKAVKF
jgi:hypothetical protein